MQLFLSSNTIQRTSSFSTMIGNTKDSSLIRTSSGIVSIIDCDKAMYSASVVLKDIYDCNFECHMIGYHP